MAINPGSTTSDFNLKAGTGRLHVIDRCVRPTLTALSNDLELSVALTSALTTMTTLTDIAAKEGDIICFARTEEKVLVAADTTGVGPYTTDIIRGIDGTTAQAAPIGATFSKVGIGVRINAASYDLDAVTMVIDKGGDNADLIDASHMVFRRSRDAGSIERMYLVSHSTNEINLKRNLSLEKDDLVDVAIVQDEILLIAAEGYVVPENETLLKSLWREFEISDAFTLSEEFESTQTASNLRVGTNYAGQSRFSVGFTLVITDPQFLSYLRPNRPLQINNSAGTLQKDQGYSMRSFPGEELIGVMFYLTGKEAITNKQLQIVAFDAQLTEPGDLTVGPDQREMEVTFQCSHYELFDSPGAIKNPLACTV